MTILIIFAITFTVLFGGRFLVRMNTLKLHSEYYRKADERGCAERYDSLVRLYKSSDPRILEMAYLEAISCTKAA
ncbi:hypothetical protein V2Z46_004347 [Salmonella enterica]|uniref:Uncharacterized protein n=2 Tax=Salmonella enterica TaxID=28901 RepID=A0A624IUS9_SALER|nr:hypothetical protein [Salmonella enterica]EAP4170506.1 hypothetical protein [Salmonella enterica subsp. enterica serovar Minnesota]ECY7799328.1 hypothetical protein [Salmonella enterica subsp. enterica serovar Itami]EDH5351980.1 hypothetical protein [Salmonella enterica subsp. enterica serovar Montevideo]EDK0704981.1 hypothetical protein [Salmonella bongori]EDK3135777.1 hypothetical protein [Salmonella enterica subsp. enterica serovar Newport]EDQ2836496.1 hypothetical protein [Salmonella e